MDYVIQPPDRELFKRCRRAWDFGARTRRNLEPGGAADLPAADRPAADPSDADPRGRDTRRVVDRALRDALAVYYFPGMWDWQPMVVLPLVFQAFDRSVSEQCAGRELGSGLRAAIGGARRLLERYTAWAPSVDRFAPIRVASDVDVQVPDPRSPAEGLAVEGGLGGGAVRYSDRVDLLVIDEHNAYWALTHRVVRGGLPDTDQLLLDEQCLAWCWAFELSYPGMRLAGTIYNELRAGGADPDGADLGSDDPAGRDPGGRDPGGDRGSGDPGSRDRGSGDRDSGDPGGPGEAAWGAAEGSAPGRSVVSQHRQAYAPPTTAREPPPGSPRISQRQDGPFRRTQIRRGRSEIAEFGTRLGLQALDMIDPALRLYPNPGPRTCAECAYRAPCIAVNEGADVEAVIAASYRPRPAEPPEEGRLGGSTWSVGRGAAPPPWLGRDHPGR